MKEPTKITTTGTDENVVFDLVEELAPSRQVVELVDGSECRVHDVNVRRGQVVELLVACLRRQSFADDERVPVVGHGKNRVGATPRRWNLKTKNTMLGAE